MSESLNLMKERRQGVTIIHVNNEHLLDPRLADDLTRHLCALLEEGTPRLLLDLGVVSRISSVYFRSFITAGKKANSKNAVLAFCNLSKLIKEGFTITGLDKLFRLYDSEAKAMNEIGEKE
jgi:anti-anti-sigma factor